MKKILFNEKYGLNDLVLQGEKTQTRRIITYPKKYKGRYVSGYYVYRNSKGEIAQLPEIMDEDGASFDDSKLIYPSYFLGEKIAIGERYETIYNYYKNNGDILSKEIELLKNEKGWKNKMFVKSDKMIHFIKITGIKIERLQEISDIDCIAEGVIYKKEKYYIPNSDIPYDTPQLAYARLIDKISGKGTWDKNPFVWCYKFELSNN